MNCLSHAGNLGVGQAWVGQARLYDSPEFSSIIFCFAMKEQFLPKLPLAPPGTRWWIVCLTRER